MRNTIIIIGLILGLTSCTHTKYIVKSEKDLSQVNWENNILNYIPITDDDLNSSSLLDTTYRLIILKKYSKLNKYLSSPTIKSNTSDFYLAKTLYLISKSEYQEAYVNLTNIDDNNYELIHDLLSIDLSYELTRLNGAENYNKFLKDYQALIDKYNDNELLKNIISLRTRYIRYNY